MGSNPTQSFSGMVTRFAAEISRRAIALYAWLLPFLRRRWKRILTVLVIVIPVAALGNFLFAEPKPEYLTQQVERGNLLQTVEAVATVISEKDLELKFPVSGIVEELLVSEGDSVTAGGELARLRSGSLKAAVTAAQARLTTANAEFRALKEGSRPEDIIIAEAEVQNKQASIDAAQAKFDTAVSSLQKAEVKLIALNAEAQTATAGLVATSTSTIINELSVAQIALGAVDNVFDNLTLRNIIVQQQPAEYAQLLRRKETVYGQILAKKIGLIPAAETQSAITSLTEAASLTAEASSVLQGFYDFLTRQEALGLFSVATKEELRQELATEKTNTETSVNDLNTALKTLRDKDATYRTQIAAEETTLANSRGTRDQALADIATYRTALTISQAQLSLKRAGTRKADIDASYGRVLSARAEYEKAQADYEDTILRAPIDGIITKVNLKKGEFTPGQFSETVPAVTILGVSPYRTEVFVSEVDIPRVRYGQSGSLLLDAYPDRVFPVVVNEIDPAATTVDGVPKYRIKLDFDGAYDELLKIGMTGDLDIVTDTREDVVYVPARAVIIDESGRTIVRILGKNGKAEDRPVSAGMETVNDVEIQSGVLEGETVIVLVK